MFVFPFHVKQTGRQTKTYLEMSYLTLAEKDYSFRSDT